MNTVERRPLIQPRILGLVLATILLTILVTGGVLYLSGTLGLRSRQMEVAARGAAVMPFDLDQTNHIFELLPNGGVQKVVAKDPGDTQQIEFIRGHLRAESDKFAQGDFADPAAIHGNAMPGLATLQAGATSIGVQYDTLADGAQIRFTSDDPDLVTAIHAWFAAQRADHGTHVVHPDHPTP